MFRLTRVRRSLKTKRALSLKPSMRTGNLRISGAAGPNKVVSKSDVIRSRRYGSRFLESHISSNRCVFLRVAFEDLIGGKIFSN